MARKAPKVGKPGEVGAVSLTPRPSPLAPRLFYRPAHSHCRAARAMLRRVRHALPSAQHRTGALTHVAQTKKRKNSKFDKGKKIQSGGE